KDKNVEKLLEYQRLIAKITEDNRRLREIEEHKAELDRAKREMIALYNKVVEKEELAEQDEETIIAYNKSVKKKTKSKAKRKQETKKTREEYNKKANEVKDKTIEYREKTLVTSQQKKDVKVKMDMFAEENSKGTLSKSKKDIFEMANNMLKDDLIEKANNEVNKGTKEISYISATLNPNKKAKEEKDKTIALLDNPKQKRRNSPDFM
ncbi:hypothetical protein GSY74_07875, partial [Sulfurovum sp. bin170]|uniref:hypothetical protein n=1 Tax=Sulfurovum sp. bin170 TaxID=2695268 RepID=UPI0013DE88FE